MRSGVRNIRYAFLGIHDECRIFRLIFISGDGYLTMCLIFADADTKDIRRMELRTLSTSTIGRLPDTDFHLEDVDVVIECQNHVVGRTTTTFINYVKAKIETRTGEMRFSEIELSNMRVVSR